MIREFSSSDVLFMVFAVRWTLLLSAIAFITGGAGGLIVALARTSSNALLRNLTSYYVLLFRGTPLLMQIFLVYFGFAVLRLPIDPLLAA